MEFSRERNRSLFRLGKGKCASFSRANFHALKWSGFLSSSLYLRRLSHSYTVPSSKTRDLLPTHLDLYADHRDPVKCRCPVEVISLFNAKALMDNSLLGERLARSSRQLPLSPLPASIEGASSFFSSSS